MAQKSPLPTLGHGHSSGASCSGNALKGALSAPTLFISGCVPFPYKPCERKRSVVSSALFGMGGQEKHLVLEEVKDDCQSNGRPVGHVIKVRSEDTPAEQNRLQIAPVDKELFACVPFLIAFK